MRCSGASCDNVEEMFDGGSGAVREEEDWIVTAGNREEGLESWTEQ